MKSYGWNFFGRLAVQFFIGGSALALLTVVCFHYGVNPTTVALLFLLVIVVTSLKTDFAPAALLSVIAYLVLDAFFTAPLFQLGMSEPLDFVAPVAYLITSLVITRLMKNSRQSFKEIRDLKDQLRLIVDTIPGMVWSALPDGKPDFLNQRWLDYTGVSREEGLDWDGKIAIHSSDRERFLQDWQKAFETGKPLETEVRLRSSDGKYRQFLIRAIPLRNEHGEIVKWFGINTDIEEQKQIEEALRKTQANLASLSAELNMGEMAAAIAHEINQPLAGIVTNAGACLRWLNGNPPNLEEAGETARRIIRDGNRASEVIIKIRALLKKSEPLREPLNINQVIREVINLVRREIEANKIKLHLELNDDLPLVSGDRIQLQQVVFNLVMNAIEAMSAGGEKSRELFCETSLAEKEKISVRIKDTGSGIGKTGQTNIFEAFVTTKPQGMGMGLAISRSVIESHQGEICLTETGENGTTFQFTVPTGRKDND